MFVPPAGNFLCAQKVTKDAQETDGFLTSFFARGECIFARDARENARVGAKPICKKGQCPFLQTKRAVREFPEPLFD